MSVQSLFFLACPNLSLCFSLDTDWEALMGVTPWVKLECGSPGWALLVVARKAKTFFGPLERARTKWKALENQMKTIESLPSHTIPYACQPSSVSCCHIYKPFRTHPLGLGRKRSTRKPKKVMWTGPWGPCSPTPSWELTWAGRVRHNTSIFFRG